jgi:AbrB family looped-hinge helix DNA binding protein
MSTVSRIQHKGQVTIPTRLRNQAGLSKGDLVEFSFHRGKIVITPKVAIDSLLTTNTPLSSAASSTPGLMNPRKISKKAVLMAPSTPPMRG